METYKINVKFKTSFSSELTSDIIFGHICWAYRFLYSEEELLKFLRDFYEHPVVISSMFPQKESEELFFPNIPCVLSVEEEEIVKSDDDYRKLKKIRKLNYIPFELIKKFKDDFSIASIVKELMRRYNEVPTSIISNQEVAHNTIDRLNNMVIEGRFFVEMEYFLKEGFSFYFLIKDSYFGKQKLEEILQYLSNTGLGKDKTTGKGQFSYQLSSYNLEESTEGNAFILLSRYIPTSNEEVNGYYKIRPKIGRLGEHYAHLSPFYKKPLLFLQEGSILFSNEKKKFYGGIIDKVHSKPDIRHYGIGFPYFIKFRQ